MDRLKTCFFSMLQCGVNFFSLPQHSKSCGVLSSSEVRFLSIIGEKSGLSISEISDSLNISKSAASQFVEKLVKKKYVKRIHDSKDRRQVKNVLTVRGEELFLEYNDCRNMLMEKLEEEIKKYNIDNETAISLFQIVEKVMNGCIEKMEKK